MDATTIQEIANQLGIAVDKVANIIPQYAAAWILTLGVPMGILFVLLITSIIVTLIFFKKCSWYYINYKQLDNLAHNEQTKEIIKQKYTYLNKYDFYNIAKIVTLVILVIIFVIFILNVALNLSDLLNWIYYPDAIFFNHMLKVL